MRNLKKYYTVLAALLVFIASNSAEATDVKIGVFISGLGSNGWQKTELPTAWKGTVFDKVINLDQEINRLRTDGLAKINQQSYMKLNFADKIRAEAAKYRIPGQQITVHVVLIGHSVVGGYVSRYIASRYEELGLKTIKDPISGLLQVTLNVSAVTVGTPHQGVALSAVSVEPKSGYVNVQPVLDRFSTELTAGLNEDIYAFGGFGLLQDIAAFFRANWNPVNWVIGIFTDPDAIADDLDEIADYRKILNQVGPDYLEPRLKKAGDIIGDVSNTRVLDYSLKSAISPDLGPLSQRGFVINELNRGPNPVFYRSVLGAEKYPVPTRFSSEILNVDYELSVPIVGTLASFNDEREFVDTFDNARWFAKAQKNLWWFAHEVAYYSSRWTVLWKRKAANRKKDRMKRRSNNWGRTRAALDNIDRYWARAINSYRYETRTGTRQVYDPYKCTTGGGKDPYALKTENINLLIPVQDPNCDPWRNETYTYTVQIPLKNDGVSAPKYDLWNAGDQLNSSSDNNFYYSDLGDGGYNHLELRRHKRQYRQGANRKGDLAEPMLQTKNWLEEKVLN